MHNDDRLDQILDAALANYIEEPRIGLEQRVLANAHADARDERRPWLHWSLGFGVATCLLVVLFVFTHTAPRKSEVARVVSKPAPAAASPQPSVETVAKPSVRRRAMPHVTNHTEPLPKLAQFPTPSPLSADESALLGLVRRSKPEAIQALSQQKAEPLSIAEIQIEDIQIEPLSSGGK